MADASRPSPRAQRYTQARPRTVQPPDDRTYSAEVTGFHRNLPHHRIARAVSLHAPNYDSTPPAICQEKFLKNFTKISMKRTGSRPGTFRIPAPFRYQDAFCAVLFRGGNSSPSSCMSSQPPKTPSTLNAGTAKLFNRSHNVPRIGFAILKYHSLSCAAPLTISGQTPHREGSGHSLLTRRIFMCAGLSLTPVAGYNLIRCHSTNRKSRFLK